MIISITALVFSQLPPVGTWINRIQVDAVVGRRIGLDNAIGIIGYQIFIDLKNSGNRTANLTKPRLHVTYPNGTIKKLEAQFYSKIIAGQDTPLQFPITNISIGPGLNWSEMVSFYQSFSPTEDEVLNRIRLKISQSIFSKQVAMTQSQSSQFGRIFEADAPFVDEAIQFFSRKFDLEKGAYKISVMADINGTETTLNRLSFTLYDFHIQTIRSQTEEYKYGAGINFSTIQLKQVGVWVTEAE
ncbi:hypothetical protein BH20PSE1_BH20PSE1_20790 [soil metagenome]